MEMKELLQTVKKIEMTEEMKNKIMNHCYKKMEENVVSKRKKEKTLEKPLAAAASVAVCFCLIGIITMASTGKLEGFFKDIKRWDGAVVGTSYEQATDEIYLSVISATEKLTVMAEMTEPDNVPYCLFTTFGLENFIILDKNGKTMMEDKKTNLVEVVDGKAIIEIPIEELSSGEFKLVVNKFIGSAKADQPLILNGTWECEFAR